MVTGGRLAYNMGHRIEPSEAEVCPMVRAYGKSWCISAASKVPCCNPGIDVSRAEF